MRVWRVGWLGLVAATTASTSIAACRQIEGIKDSPPMDLTTTCGLQFDTASCAPCVSKKCCTESNACAASPACATYESCIGSCSGDPRCRSQCTLDDRVGAGSTAEISTLNACVAANCELECGLSCGGVADYVSSPTNAAACAQCVQTNTCSVGRKCARSVDCDAYIRCMLSCPTSDCREACVTEHPSGAAIFGDPSAFSLSLPGAQAPPANTFSSNYAGVCAEACGYGENWSCAGVVVWPRPLSTTTTLTLAVADYTTPIAGATATFCLGGGCYGSGECLGAPGCVTSLGGSGTTDSGGHVSFSVPTPQQGAYGYVMITAAGYIPTYYYPADPITEPTVTLSATAMLATPSELMGMGGGPSLGVILAYPLDCLDDLAPQVQITETPDVGPFLYMPHLPNGGGIIFGDGGLLGASTGPGFLSGVPEGYYQLTAVPLALATSPPNDRGVRLTGQASGTVNIYVHAGALTVVTMVPTP
jgi:hypothetical protein